MQALRLQIGALKNVVVLVLPHLTPQQVISVLFHLKSQLLSEFILPAL